MRSTRSQTPPAGDMDVYQQLLKSEQEKTVLLSINQAISTARTATELLGIIREKVMQLIPFYDTGILIVEKDGLHHYDLAVTIPGWDESATNLALHKVVTSRIPHPGSPIAAVMDKLAEQGGVRIESFEYLAAHFEHPYLPTLIEAGFKEGLVVLLKSVGRTYGTFWLNSRKKNHFKKEQFPLFEAIAGQVSVAVAHILARQESLEREREKALLLEISQAISRIDNKLDFLRNLDALLKPIFKHTDAGILIVDEDKNTMTDLYALYNQYIPSTEESKRLNSLYAAQNLVVMTFRGSLIEYAMQQPPMFGRLDDAQTWGFDAPYLTYEIENGLTHFMGAPLQVSGQKLGLFNLLFTEENAPQPSQLVFFAQLTDIIAVALANLLSKEEILAREEEKTRLLEISAHLSRTKSTPELFEVIFKKIKPLLDFDHIVIGILDKEKKFQTAFLADLNWETEQEKGNLGQLMRYQFPFDDFFKNLFAAEDVVVIFSAAEEYQKDKSLTYLKLMADAGIRETMALPLSVLGEVIGGLYMHSNARKNFNTLQFPLFKSITNQIAIAAANILASEEILKREKEKALLLSISESLATIRDKQQLLKVVIEKLRPLFGFYDTGLFVLDRDRQYIDDWTVTLGDIDHSQANTRLRESGAGRIPFANSAMEWAINYLKEMDGPHIFQYTQEVYDQFPDYPQFAVIKQVGYKECMAALLRRDNGEIGILFFNALKVGHFSSDQLPMFQAIADQIAVAVANILANEEIAAREQEKSGLLHISEAICRIKNKKELLQVIYQHIQPVFPFDSAGLFITDPEKDVIYEMLDNEAFPDELQKKLTDEHALGPWQLSRSNTASWWMQEDIVIRPMEQEALYAKGHVDEAQFNAVISYGLKHFIGGPMYANGKKIGAICFNSRQEQFYSQVHLSMFKSISEQVAVAVANMLAYEEILQSAAEKNLLLEKIKDEEEIKSVLLSINNNLINIQDRNALLLKLAEELSKLILIDSFGLKTIHENKQFSERLFFTRKPDNCFEALTSLPAEIENNMDELDRHELGESLQEPVIYVGEKFDEMCRKYLLYRIAREKSGIQSVLIAPLKSRDGRKSLLVIKSKKAYAYHTNELLLLDRILPQLAIVMENFISYDNVKQLKNLLEAENVYLQEEVKTLYNFEEIVGNGEALQEALEKTGIVAKTDTTVLLLGETGTGKELFARAIHNLSPRNKKPLIKINCAALPPQLIESELFGHERGAFTGAIDRRTGKFELAHGSTLFLDEIGEMPLDLQSKLLRAIQEKEIERLGSNKTIKTDVRIIAATNRDLAAEVEAKRFRSDLFFRLHVFPVTLPPLRDRKEDIPLLVTHFVEKFSKKLGKPLRGISTDALQALSTYHYPGNIRELEHILERSAILSKNSLIKEVYLPKNDKKPAFNNIEDFRIKSFEENERDYILQVLKKCKGKIYGTGSASELLGLPPTTLASKMKKLGITKEHKAG